MCKFDNFIVCFRFPSFSRISSLACSNVCYNLPNDFLQRRLTLKYKQRKTCYEMNVFPIRPNDRFDAMSTCYCVQALTQTSSPNTYIAFQCSCEVISRTVSGQYGWCRTADLFSFSCFPYLNYPIKLYPIIPPYNPVSPFIGFPFACCCHRLGPGSSALPENRGRALPGRGCVVVVGVVVVVGSSSK